MDRTGGCWRLSRDRDRNRPRQAAGAQLRAGPVSRTRTGARLWPRQGCTPVPHLWRLISDAGGNQAEWFRFGPGCHRRWLSSEIAQRNARLSVCISEAWRGAKRKMLCLLDADPAGRARGWTKGLGPVQAPGTHSPEMRAGGRW